MFDKIQKKKEEIIYTKKENRYEYNSVQIIYAKNSSYR